MGSDQPRHGSSDDRRPRRTDTTETKTETFGLGTPAPASRLWSGVCLREARPSPSDP